MNPLRIEYLKEGYRDESKQYVIYFMQQSQRIHYNHALNHAIEIANQYQLPLMIFFSLYEGYPEANMRHFQFMLEGLKDVYNWANKLHMNMVIKKGTPEETIKPFLDNAQALVMDKGYLKPQLHFRNCILSDAQAYPSIDVSMVDTDLIVPVRVASDKVEYGAYTIRPKLNKLFQAFNDHEKTPLLKNQSKLNISSDIDLNALQTVLDELNVNRDIKPSPIYKGGYVEASKHLFNFIQNKVHYYEESSDPSTDYNSNLSMYIHFGQISTLEILDQLKMALDQEKITETVYEAYKEQIFIRRELAFNYCYYNPRYDTFIGMTEPWAYETMKVHQSDERVYLYTKDDYINYRTHDPYFNAAMKEMVETGFMHNYMRMYWAKKIIEWSHTHEVAYQTIISLNNAYFIDGRDPNSYTGVAWCFGKHDRAWTERPIFGKLRYMNDKGLERKFDMQGYINKVNFK